MKLPGSRQAAFCKRHVVLVLLLLSPIVGRGAAGASAVVCDCRSAINEIGEKEDRGLQDMLWLSPERIFRHNGVFLEETEYRFGNLD